MMIILFYQTAFAFGQDDQRVRISLVGDILMDGSVGRYIEKNGVDYPWEKVKEVFSYSDLVLGNLETSVGGGGQADANKQYTFQSKPATLKGLVNAGIGGISIANNHVLDYGQEGFMETLYHLERSGIKYAGGGRNMEEALQPAIWEIKGMRIGFLAFSRVIYDVSWYAGAKKPGILSAYDHYAKEVCDIISKTREKVDFLIVSVHWGKELAQYPEENEIKLGRMMIDSGADVIMGHHPHVLQGVEFYNNKPILYSLGNFVFSSSSQLSRTSMIFNLEINPEGIIKAYVVPVRIHHCQPVPVKDKEAEEVIHLLNTLSKQWDTKFLKNGDIVGKIEYVKPKGRDSSVDKKDMPPPNSMPDPSIGRDVRIEKLERLSKFFGYDLHFDVSKNRAMLIKEKETIILDYHQTLMTIRREKKGWLNSFFIHKPLQLLCKFFKWDFQYQ
ncbi:Capsule biosynthesis protein CapA [Thermotalea metallivorans]|uniref:Capsule biosynthesis protein CapA n=2 Tax=Thermotalea metallivorans TaxID=520762 RepID=A0A140L5U1_9FIRM|nr:Capsule biosynthesis protein CapA [Thermotalea metallivorans]